MPFMKRLTVSTPAATNTSPSPALMACVAMRMVWSDDEQYRFTVTPGTSGMPAWMAAMRGDVVAGLAGRLAAAQDHVLDVAPVERRHLVQHGVDDERREVVGPQVLQRPLHGPADRGAGGRDDHGFGHWTLLL